jgi:hypothetical protein
MTEPKKSSPPVTHYALVQKEKVRIKKLIFILIVMMASHVYAGGGWEGSKVKVPKGTLLCDYFHMEKALILKSAGDKASLQAFLNKGYCLIAPREFYATVVKDASEFTRPPLAEIMIEGNSIWAAMKDVDCCYK